MSSTKWIRRAPLAGYDNSMCVSIVTDYQSVGEIARYSTELNMSVITGDYTKWCSSLIWFPMVFFDLSNNRSAINISGQPIYGTKGAHILGFNLNLYLGSWFVDEGKTFRAYEPYTTCEVYLPFYGTVPLSMGEINQKWVHILLNIDARTGQAMYIIGVTDSSLEYSGESGVIHEMRCASYYNLEKLRIISQTVFQLGIPVPLGSANMAETYRNIIMSTVKGISQGISAITPTQKSTTTWNFVNRNKNGEVTSTREGIKHSTKQGGSLASSAIESSVDVINSLRVSPTTDKVSNCAVASNTTMSVHFIFKKVKFKYKTPTEQDEFRHLYGVPLGETKQLKEVYGYTEISNIHIEGEGFNKATETEKNMLNDILTSGVILEKWTNE